jgi:hypothetical protein
MNAARVFKTVDAQLVAAVPELREFEGRRVELIVMDSASADERDAPLADPPRRRPALAAVGVVRGLEGLTLADERRLLDEARIAKHG